MTKPDIEAWLLKHGYEKSNRGDDIWWKGNSKFQLASRHLKHWVNGIKIGSRPYNSIAINPETGRLRFFTYA